MSVLGFDNRLVVSSINQLKLSQCSGLYQTNLLAFLTSLESYVRLALLACAFVVPKLDEGVSGLSVYTLGLCNQA